MNAVMMECQFLGRIGYDEAYHLQRSLWRQRALGEIPDQLLLLEHSPVITLGRNARSEHLLHTSAKLESLGVQVREADRGGDVTYHGPGQLIGYPIINLQPERMDVLRYLRDLEEVLIEVCEHYGFYAGRREGQTGVWVEDRKIASIGVKISRWVTYHGFALNVSTDLSAFDLIVPCGNSGVKMTSIQEVTGRAPELEEVAQVAADKMNLIFHTMEIDRA
ncbi:MAG TPA: lipoyl(octanoyl) transferase LipB [bacterium]